MINLSFSGCSVKHTGDEDMEKKYLVSIRCLWTIGPLRGNIMLTLFQTGAVMIMEKYTSLEQAVNDPSLAIITDQAATWRELNRVYFSYRAMPRPQRRFSDYFSNLFLGHTVPEMYLLLKEERKPERNIPEDLQLPRDKYAVSEPDLYYREESFNSGETNVCILLGHSGSGKSVMARRLTGENIDHIELDDLLLTRDHFTMEELKAYSDLIYSFFSGEGAKYYIGLEERNSIPKEEYEDRVFTDFIHYALDYARQHRERKYILDGIWIYLYFDDPSVFAPYTVFIKGTSFLKSKIRATKREMQRDRETVRDRKEMFGREVRNYLLDEDKIDRYRSFFSGLPDTVFREETSEAARQEEAVSSELNHIDACFVDGDSDGIRGIMKKWYQGNHEKSGRRQRIIPLEQTEDHQ